MVYHDHIGLNDDHDANHITARKWAFFEFHTSPKYYDVPKDKITPKILWSQITWDTSAHGVPHIDIARGFIKKAFWAIVFSWAMCMMIYTLYGIFSLYFSYPFSVILTVETERELTFPAVTICNMNPIKLSKIAIVPEIEALVDSPASNVSLEGQPIADSSYPGRVYQTDIFRKQNKLAELLADTPLSIKTTMGYDVKEFILDCEYAGYECSTDEFLEFFNPIHGNCFVFNSGWENTTIRTSYDTGRRHGLKLIVNVNQDEYLLDIAEAAGVRLVVHDQDDMPFPEDEGVVVSAGMLTSIAVKKMDISRLGLPYDPCIDTTILNLTTNVYEEYYEVFYSASACYKTCYQSYVMQRCNCGDPMYPLTGTAFGNISVLACNSSDIVQDDCHYETSVLYNNGSLDCSQCLLPCAQVSYTTDVSSVDWPSDVYEPELLHDYAEQLVNLTNNPNDTEKFERSVLKIEVYFDEFSFQNIEEEPSYPPSLFASDIGGTIGLWCGASVLTVFDFLEFFMDLIILACMKFKRKHFPGKGGSSIGLAGTAFGCVPYGGSGKPAFPPSYNAFPPSDHEIMDHFRRYNVNFGLDNAQAHSKQSAELMNPAESTKYSAPINSWT